MVYSRCWTLLLAASRRRPERLGRPCRADVDPDQVRDGRKRAACATST